jgi:hypothetical protein
MFRRDPQKGAKNPIFDGPTASASASKFNLLPRSDTVTFFGQLQVDQC